MLWAAAWNPVKGRGRYVRCWHDHRSQASFILMCKLKNESAVLANIFALFHKKRGLTCKHLARGAQSLAPQGSCKSSSIGLRASGCSGGGFIQHKLVSGCDRTGTCASKDVSLLLPQFISGCATTLSKVLFLAHLCLCTPLSDGIGGSFTGSISISCTKKANEVQYEVTIFFPDLNG